MRQRLLPGTEGNSLPSLDNNPTYVGIELPPVGYARSSTPKEHQISSAFHECRDSIQIHTHKNLGTVRTHEDWVS